MIDERRMGSCASFAHDRIRLPGPVDISTLSETEFNEELEKGYANMQDGRTKNARGQFKFERLEE